MVSRFSDKKVLVVEDDDDVIEYLSVWLEDRGFQVLVARDGVEALELARKEIPDLVTLDIIMPRQTGVKFFREMKDDPELESVPLIVISGVQPDMKSFLKVAGNGIRPDAFISKPFNHDELLEAIAKALQE